MANRFRKILESIAYAGMKPDSSKPDARQLRWLGPLRGPVERFLSGGTQSDPLYLSNRTLGQRMRIWLLIGAPLVVLAVGVVVAVNVLEPPDAPPPKELTPAEVAEKTLPNLAKDIHLSVNTDVEVVEVHVEHGPADKLVGTVKNKTNHEVHTGEIIFDLTESNGTQLGAVSVKVSNLAAGATTKFELPIQQKNASFALVREVHTQ
jgi:hypothetical protein